MGKTTEKSIAYTASPAPDASNQLAFRLGENQATAKQAGSARALRLRRAERLAASAGETPQ